MLEDEIEKAQRAADNIRRIRQSVEDKTREQEDLVMEDANRQQEATRREAEEAAKRQQQAEAEAEAKRRKLSDEAAAAKKKAAEIAAKAEELVNDAKEKGGKGPGKQRG